MRPSPPVRIQVTRSAVWRWAVGAWAVMSGGVLLGWAAASAGFNAAAWPVAALFSSLIVGIGWYLAGMPSVHLSWDGQVWRCSESGGGLNESPSGRISVCIDLQNWLLLRFDELGRPRSSRWIPVSKQQPDATWHMFRCAVYSPRPDAGGMPDLPSLGAERRNDPAA